MADQCQASTTSTQKYYFQPQFIGQNMSAAVPDFRRTGKCSPTVCPPKNGRTRTIVSRPNDDHSGSGNGMYF